MGDSITEEQAEALETVAAVDSMAVSDVIRTAIEHHISSRSQEDDFQEGLQARLERAQRLLRRPIRSALKNPAINEVEACLCSSPGAVCPPSNG